MKLLDCPNELLILILSFVPLYEFRHDGKTFQQRLSNVRLVCRLLGSCANQAIMDHHDNTKMFHGPPCFLEEKAQQYGPRYVVSQNGKTFGPSTSQYYRGMWTKGPLPRYYPLLEYPDDYLRVMEMERQCKVMAQKKRALVKSVRKGFYVRKLQRKPLIGVRGQTVLNPFTGRTIKAGGPAYRKLVALGCAAPTRDPRAFNE